MMGNNYKKYLYMLTFPNGMVYIGVTNGVKSRWAGNGNRYTIPEMQTAIQSYGWDNVKKEILLHLQSSFSNEQTIMAMEKALIKAYGERAYNLKSSPDWEKEQARARKEKSGTNGARIFWTIDGVTKPARDWCAEYGKSWSCVTGRVAGYGLSLKEALTFPTYTGVYRRHADMVKYFERLRQKQPT